MNSANHFGSGLSDARVASISWTDDDLIIELDLPGHPPTPRAIFFRSVSRVLIDLEYGEYVGQPLIYSASALQAATGRWTVEFTFGVAPQGKIAFECDEIVERT